MDVDVLAGEDRRLDAIGGSARLDEAHCRLDRLRHDLAELAGCLDLAFAGHRDGFDGQQLAADFGQGEASDRTDLILFLAHSVAELPDTEELAEIVDGELDALDLVLEDLAKRFASDLASSRSSVRTPASRV